MLDQAIRFGAILVHLDSPLKKGGQGGINKPAPILEVGSGSRGITVFKDTPVVGLDMVFSQKLAAGMTALKASASTLPLKDHSFDRVVCSDMLEHLDGGKRKQAIDELLRVTRGTLLLACPCGPAARRMDGFLGRLYRFFRIPIPDWLGEHLTLTLPDSEAIRLMLREQRTQFQEVEGESVLTHLLVSLLISTKAANRFWTRLFQNRSDRAKRLGTCWLLRLGPVYRRMWVVKKS